MSQLTRFGVSLDKDILEKFDRLIRRQGYASRSEAIKDLIRMKLVEREWEEEGEVVGVVVMVFNHHRRGLQDRLTDLEHHHFTQVIATQHIHLDGDNCLEAAIVRGRPARIRSLAERIQSLRGIKHCSLVTSTTGLGIV
jgi:CopG family nickel-responsive transcriptional regulator